MFGQETDEKAGAYTSVCYYVVHFVLKCDLL